MHTPRLFRVFPWVRGARAGSPGHPLFTSRVQGAGRVDNPDRYRTLYAADTRAGAVGEAFGNHHTWSPSLLTGRPDIPGSIRALAVLEPNEVEVADLDDPEELIRRELRPSTVATRNRQVTQAWAARIFDEQRFAGVRWWSYHEARWGCFGLWQLHGLRCIEVSPLVRNDPGLVEAATTLSRPWMD